MTPTPYTEDILVQQTTADYLRDQLGWESLYAYNNENFGPDSLLGRNSDREVVLTRILRERLAALNPSLPDAAYDDAVRQITGVSASQTTLSSLGSYLFRPSKRTLSDQSNLHPLTITILTLLWICLLYIQIYRGNYYDNCTHKNLYEQ